MMAELIQDRIKRHEGLLLFPYLDTTGNITVGWGHNLSASGITEHEAETLFADDFDRAVRQYEQLPGWVKSKCNEVRREVLISMIFQLGFTGVLLFKKMLKAIMVGDYSKAAEEIIDSKGCRQCPNRFHEHALRMRSGT